MIPDVLDSTGEIAVLLERFEAQPLDSGRRLRDMLEAGAAGFLGAAVPAWGACASLRGRQYLATLLAANNLLVEALCDARLSAAQAGELAREAAAANPALDLHLARRVAETADEPLQARLLEVLEAVLEGPRVAPVLSRLLAHRNPRVRSKAALLIGRANRNARWAGRQMSAADGRVRANAIEALWGVDTESSREVFWEALQDPSARVAGNAAVGLYLLGETRSIPALLNMAGHRVAAFRATAAWSMGQTLDPRFVQPLNTLRRDADGRVRQNALRAASRIRLRLQQAAALPPLRVALLAAARIDPQSRRLSVAVAGPNRAAVDAPPTRFAVWENGVLTPHYEVRARKAPEALAIGFALPRVTDTADPLGQALEQGLLACARLRRRTDTWAVLKYAEGAGAADLPDTMRLSGDAAVLAKAIRQPGPRPGGLAAVLRQLLGAVGQSRAARHVVVLGNPALLGPSEEELLLDAQAASIAVHGVAPPGQPSPALQYLCRATGGAFLRAGELAELGDGIERVCLGLLHRFEIVYRVEGSGHDPASVRLEVHTPQGSGCEECQV